MARQWLGRDVLSHGKFAYHLGAGAGQAPVRLAAGFCTRVWPSVRSVTFGPPKMNLQPVFHPSWHSYSLTEEAAAARTTGIGDPYHCQQFSTSGLKARSPSAR